MNYSEIILGIVAIAFVMIDIRMRLIVRPTGRDKFVLTLLEAVEANNLKSYQPMKDYKNVQAIDASRCICPKTGAELREAPWANATQDGYLQSSQASGG